MPAAFCARLRAMANPAAREERLPLVNPIPTRVVYPVARAAHGLALEGTVPSLLVFAPFAVGAALILGTVVVLVKMVRSQRKKGHEFGDPSPGAYLRAAAADRRGAARRRGYVPQSRLAVLTASI